MNETSIEEISISDEVPNYEDFMVYDTEDSRLKVAEDKTPRLNRADDEDKEKPLTVELSLKEKTISTMATKYGIDEETILKKVSKYKKFSQKRDDLQNSNNADFIKEAILEKKHHDEDDLVDDITNSVIKGVIKDIRSDRTLESISKKTIYNKRYFEFAKTEIIECIEKWGIYTQNEDEEGLKRIKDSRVFNSFLEAFNIVHLDSDVLSYQKMFYGKNGEINFIKLISFFFGNDGEKKKIRDLTEDIEKLNLRMDSVFSL